jgi:soluble lytic murein transglycosylase-like protein
MILNSSDIIKSVDSVYPSIFSNSEIPREVICGQIMQESSGDTKAFLQDSNGGSYGLMQIDKDVLPIVGFPSDTNLYDANSNLQVGMLYDKMMYDGSLSNNSITNISEKWLRVAMSLVCYNCGVGNFNELYTNHLANGNITSWNEAIQNSNLVSNWSTCLEYPVFIFYKAKLYFDLDINSTIQIPQFETPVVLF